MTLILLLTLAVLLSAVLDKFIKFITLPLVQILLGIVIAVFASGTVNITLDPELFLVIFIAPLLYIEAKHADRLSLWRDIKPILGLAIGLVIVTSLAIGIALHAYAPAVSIWAALALGAALGPTDAVAVTSVSKTTNIPPRAESLLKGELLLNDASGIVMFQVAIAAVTAGAIDYVEAGWDFLLEFVGGLLVGLAIAYVTKFFLKKMRENGLDSIVFHVLFELCLPFVVYLFSTSVHVSGIIAVVAAGLVNPVENISATPTASRMSIVSDSVWDVLSFVLNGIVFVLLGTQIPTAMFYVWESTAFNNEMLIVSIILVTFILLLTRFVWCYIMSHWQRHTLMGEGISVLKRALILTFSGAKGTITLSILFTLPYYLASGSIFGSRMVMIFIGSGVIVATLLLATFVLPLIAPKEEVTEAEEEKREKYYLAMQEVLREVILKLTASENDLNRLATRQVINDYQIRLDKAKSMTDDDDEDTIELRLKVLHWEKDKAREMIEEGKVEEEVGEAYIERLDNAIHLYSHGLRFVDPSDRLVAMRNVWRRVRRTLKKIFGLPASSFDLEVRQFTMVIERYALDRLKEEMAESYITTEHAAKIVLEYERHIAALSQKNLTVTKVIRANDEVDEVRAYAYRCELDAIEDLQEQGKLPKGAYRRMRENVSVMQLELNDAI